MMRTVLKSPVGIAAMLTLLLLAVLSAIEIVREPNPHQGDFKVYLTAAHLVREHKGAEIYNEADTGQDPQMRSAPANSIFQRTASAIGIPEVRLYVYPPTLADLLVPFTFLSLRHAGDAWLALDVLTFALAAMLVTWLLYDTVLHIAWLGIFIGILCFRANTLSLSQGQISCVLLLLWVAGIVFYVKGYKRTSAVLLALAAAIKLTPLLAVLPLLIWREWRWIRWFALSLFILCLVLCAVNGPQTFADYALHVMPPMSKGFPANANISLPTELPQLYLSFEKGARRLGMGGHLAWESAAALSGVAFGAKLITGAVLLAVFFCIYMLGANRSALDRAKILALIALLSHYCSPVAWQSAYGIVFFVALLLWRDALKFGASRTELALLVFCTLEFGFFFDAILLPVTRGAVMNAATLIAPVSGCILIFCTLRKMSLARNIPMP